MICIGLGATFLPCLLPVVVYSAPLYLLRMKALPPLFTPAGQPLVGARRKGGLNK